MNARWFVQRPIRLVVALLVVAIVGGGGYYLARRSGSSTPGSTTGQPVPVQVTAARTGPIRSVLTYSGAIQAAQQVNVSPRSAGQLASLKVEVGTEVKAGDPVATLDPGTLPAQLQQAQASLQSAQARLDYMITGSREVDIAAAQAALDAAQARLNQLLKPSPADLSAAQSAVVSAQVTLDNAKSTVISTRSSLLSSLTTYCNTYNHAVIDCGVDIPLATASVEALQRYLASNTSFAGTPAGTNANTMLTANASYVNAMNNVTSAEQSLIAAQNRLAQLQSPTAADVAAQRSAVEAARATYETRRSPYTDADFAGARATVAQAQAALAAAKTAVDQTTVVAPFDGVIAQKLLEVGSTVSSQTPIFVMVAKALETHLTVDEARVGQIKNDMEAEVTVPAYPGRIFRGRVATIAPLGDARAHTFDVKVLAADPEGLLKPGMFAQVNVVVATKSNAILVPTSAIVQQGPVSRVFIVANGKAAAKNVKIGIADATNSEITEGVAAGDQVVTVGQNVVRDGQAVQIATPGAGGARPSGTPGASPSGTPAPGGSPAASPAASGTPTGSGTPARPAASGTAAPSGTPPARPSGTGTP